MFNSIDIARVEIPGPTAYWLSMQTSRVLLSQERSESTSPNDEFRTRASRAMERYASGDDRAFEDLYTLLAPRLYRSCIGLIGRAEADDLLQEVFLKMHRARASFVPGGSVLAWSLAIARSTWIDRLRKKKRRPEYATGPEQIETHASEGATCPESSSSSRVLESVLEKQLAALSESLRSAYVLVKIEGLPHAEAADVLGISTNAVKQRVHRATEELKSALSQAGW